MTQESGHGQKTARSHDVRRCKRRKENCFPRTTERVRHRHWSKHSLWLNMFRSASVGCHAVVLELSSYCRTLRGYKLLGASPFAYFPGYIFSRRWSLECDRYNVGCEY